MQAVHTFTSSLTIGSPTLVDGLGAYPLFRAADSTPFYDTLSEAVRAGTLHISEMSEAGVVPQLRVVNDGARPVLIVDGEELVGAKQNRIVNLTVLVPERSTMTLPVTCVEAGRWRRVSPEFVPAERAFYASGRRDKLGQVTASMRTLGAALADQSAVWSEIAHKSERLGAASPTRAAAAMYEQRRDALDRIVSSFPPADRQVGAIFTIRGAVVGLDAFDHPRTWAQMVPKLLRSYGLDTLDTAAAGSGPAAADPLRFLEAVAHAGCTVYPAVGAGIDLRLEGGGIVGAALDTAKGVVHIVAFPASDVVQPTGRRWFRRP